MSHTGSHSASDPRQTASRAATGTRDQGDHGRHAAGARSGSSGHDSDLARSGGRGHDEGHAESHGHSVAAWTGVLIVIIGSAIGGIGVILAEVWLAALGIALMPLGGLVGWLLGRRKGGGAAHASSGPHGTGGH